MDEYVYIGKICATHGIKGELRIKSDFERKNQVFIPGFSLYIGPTKQKEIITTYRPHKQFDMVSFSPYDNINQVLKYLSLPVYVKRSDLNLKSQEYILNDLLNCVIIEQEENLGVVTDIIQQGKNTLLEVDGKQHFYLPNNKQYIKKIDLQNKKIEVENATKLIF